MSYKDINEKYKKIFESGLKAKVEEEKRQIEEIKERDAGYSYDKSFDEVMKLMKTLQQKLQKHKKAFNNDQTGRGRKDWGYVGDLGKIKEDLKEAVNFLNV